MRVILSLVVVALVALPLHAQTASAERELLVKADEARSVGSADPVVTLIEFFDYSCTSCQQFHVTVGDSLKASLGADVRLIYMGYLIPRFFRSYHAAEAALCAATIGGRAAYTAMSDKIFRGASDIGRLEGVATVAQLQQLIAAARAKAK